MLHPRTPIATIAAVALLTATIPADVEARGATVTSGQFTTLPGGAALGYEITGSATMVRTGSDRTIVSVRAAGLDPHTTYGVHVHNAPCDAPNPGGGHYQHVVGGPVDPVNEMWPTISTGGGGRGSGHASHEHRARADAQAIVIHHAETPAIRLACLDLA